MTTPEDDEQETHLVGGVDQEKYTAMWNDLMAKGKPPREANAYLIAKSTFDHFTEICRLNAALATLRAERDELREALEKIATQPLWSEMDLDLAGQENFLDDYEGCVKDARAALNRQGETDGA